jgi:BirA family transcriptional regulator, biotin operon repressor / biotin---[acetyl-CoA-carboxylase] ligase
MGWPFVRTLVHHETLASTSDLARALAAQETLSLPLAVRANRQTRGRGRGTHAWWSDAGSLTFTLVLDPAGHGLRPEHEPRLALASAVAVINAVAREFLSPSEAEALGIRWPNDVEAAGRKLGGILPERVVTPLGPRLLIGIGLNVLTHVAEAPADVQRMAVAVAELHRDPMPSDALDRAFRAILEQFQSVSERLSWGDPTLAERWDQLDLLRDRWVRVDLGPRIVIGLGRGIDPDGSLRLATEHEAVRLFGGQVLRDDDQTGLRDIVGSAHTDPRKDLRESRSSGRTD